mmetsp:Transcript_15265/g.41674  ORF Transcript_15265/g.41674 Transcript_15265/m.41674 type:complete len:828 (+) Transcript_15265:169-2652(+)
MAQHKPCVRPGPLSSKPPKCMQAGRHQYARRCATTHSSMQCSNTRAPSSRRPQRIPTLGRLGRPEESQHVHRAPGCSSARRQHGIACARVRRPPPGGARAARGPGAAASVGEDSGPPQRASALNAGEGGARIPEDAGPAVGPLAPRARVRSGSAAVLVDLLLLERVPGGRGDVRVPRVDPVLDDVLGPPLYQDERDVVPGAEAAVGVVDRGLARQVVRPGVALLGRLGEVAAVPHDLVAALHVVQVDPDALVVAAAEGKLRVIYKGPDVLGGGLQPELLPEGVQVLEPVEAAPVGVVVVPHGLALLRDPGLLGAVVDDRRAPGEHDPGHGVDHAGDVALADVEEPVHVVVVDEVPEVVEVRVEALPGLLDHPRGEEGQVAGGPGEEGVAEARLRRVVEGEVEHAVEAGPAARALDAGVVGHVGGGDLADDGHAGRLLELREEVEGHEAGGVQAEHVDVVGLHHPAGPVQQGLAHKGHALVQVAEVVEPALQRHALVVALALEVAGHAERGEAVPGAGAGGVPDHLAEGAGVPGGRRQVHEVGLRDGLAGEAVAGLAGAALAARPHRLQGHVRGPLAAGGGVLVEAFRADAGGVEVLDLVEGVEVLDVPGGVHRAHVVHHDVQHEAHVAVVQPADQVLEVLRGAVVRVDLVVVLGPVAHEASAVLGLSLVLLHHGRDPEGVEAHLRDVVELLGDAPNGAAAPMLLVVAGRVVPIGTCEAVEHHKVDGGAGHHGPPLLGGGLRPSRRLRHRHEAAAVRLPRPALQELQAAVRPAARRAGVIPVGRRQRQQLVGLRRRGSASGGGRRRDVQDHGKRREARGGAHSTGGHR